MRRSKLSTAEIFREVPRMVIAMCAHPAVADAVLNAMALDDLSSPTLAPAALDGAEEDERFDADFEGRH